MRPSPNRDGRKYYILTDMKLRRSKKPLLAVDYDGTLLPTYEAIVEWSDETYGTHFSPFKRKDWPDHWMHDVWGSYPAIRAAHFDRDFRKTGHAPVEESQGSIKRLCKKYDIVVISSGTVIQRKIKRRWLKTNFPQIKKVIFIDEKGRYANKSLACTALGVTAIVEDRYDYAAECSKAGIPAIILDRYEWSRGPKTTNITRVLSWTEAEKHIFTLPK